MGCLLFITNRIPDIYFPYMMNYLDDSYLLLALLPTLAVETPPALDSSWIDIYMPIVGQPCFAHAMSCNLYNLQFMIICNCNQLNLQVIDHIRTVSACTNTYRRHTTTAI